MNEEDADDSSKGMCDQFKENFNVVNFFFKQKTAYEIGTGDWSSDVCSSDLCVIVFGTIWSNKVTQ